MLGHALALLARGVLLVLLFRVDALHAFLVDEHAGATADGRAEQRVVAAPNRVAGDSSGGAADEAAFLIGSQRVSAELRRGQNSRERDRLGKHRRPAQARLSADGPRASRTS